MTTDSPDLKLGWLLEEAAERIGPDQWEVYLRSQQAAGDAGPYPRTSYIEGIHPDAGWKNAANNRIRAIHAQEKLAKVAAFEALKEELLSVRLCGWGRLGSIVGPATEIMPDQWSGLGLVSFAKSLVSDGRRKDTTEFWSVRIFPMCRLPDAPRRLAGMLLRNAYRLFVTDDPEVQSLFRHCAGGDRPSEIANEEMSALIGDDWREVVWGNSIDSDYVVNMLCSQETDGASPETEAAAIEAQKDRHRALIDLLSSGKLIAEGSSNSGSRQPIPVSVWLNPEMLVNIQTGELCARDEAGERGQRPGVLKKWSDIILTQPAEHAGLAVVTPAKADIFPAKGGRPQKYLWQEAFERLVIVLGDQGHPDKGTELAQMLLQCFEDMKTDEVPSEADATRWLRKKQARLWRRVVAAAEP